MLPIPSAGQVVLGFEFEGPGRADRLAERLPPQLARHAAVALALVTEQLATDRELASLRAAEAERTRFVSTVAHELRTPLTGLRGYLELILGGKVAEPEVERDFLERSLGIVDSMADLVGDLLELSRLESGTLELEIEPFSVAEAAARVVGGLLPIALECDIRLRTTLPPRLQSATGDRRRVEQILTNLVANALKFTAPGGSIELTARFDGPVAIIAVLDDGTGIIAEDRGRIFERFHRLEAHERITGTGLGLPIARDLARRMGGDLEVASVPGSGSAFVLALPGPAAIDSTLVTAALGRALAAEEIGLEERAVLRAMAVAGRAAPAGRRNVSGPATARLGPPAMIGPGPGRPASAGSRSSRQATRRRRYPQPRGDPRFWWITPLTGAVGRPVVSGIRTTVTRALRPARGTGKPGREPDKSRKTEARPAVRQTTTPGAAPGRPREARPTGEVPGPSAGTAPDAR